MLQHFLVAMQRRDLALAPGQQLIANGQWQRCYATNKPGNNSDGCYVLHTDGPVPWGLYRNWTDGKGVDYWRGEISRTLTEAEQQNLHRQQREAQIEAEKEAAEMAKEAAEKANRIWDRAADVPASHPYLRKKKVKPHGTKITADGLLVVPVSDGEAIVNLQFIADDGHNKWFLKGGRVKGCAFEIEGVTGTVVEAEGFATAATINEATGFTVMVAFNASNLPAVAERIRSKLHNDSQFVWQAHENVAAERGLVHERQTVNVEAETRFIIACDDDWKTKSNPGVMQGLEAARVGRAEIAMPYFGKRRRPKDTDFNDLGDLHGLDAVEEDVGKAVEPQELLEDLLLADPHSAHGTAMVEELAEWKEQDLVFYEKLLAQLKKKGVRQRELDRAVNEVIKKAAAKAAAARARTGPTEVDIRALEDSAGDIIDAENVLDRFAEDFAALYVGERNNAKLLYLTYTSRLFELKQTMHAAIKGTSSVGKSAFMNAVAEFMPPESVYKFTATSEKALLYEKRNFKHMILMMAEVLKDDKQQSFQNMLQRELMSEGILRYPVPVKVGNEIKTVVIEIEGPVVFVTSTTKNKINPENETRVLSVEMDDSPAQTRRVLLKIAEREGLNWGTSDIDFAAHHNFQRWLASGERRVYVDFADDLAKLIPPKAVRLRRDWGQLLCAIKVHALIHRQHRQRNTDGAIWATIKDYAVVRPLLTDLLDENAEVKLRKTMPETIAAVAATQGHDRDRGATVKKIAERLLLDQSAARRRLYAAEGEGVIMNLETRQGRPAQYRTTAAAVPRRSGISTAPSTPILPTVESLRAAIERRLRDENSGQSSDENGETLHASRLRR